MKVVDDRHERMITENALMQQFPCFPDSTQNSFSNKIRDPYIIVAFSGLYSSFIKLSIMLKNGT